MKGFVIRLVISAFGLWLASALIPGVRIEGVDTLLIAALLLGIVNAIIRPLIIILTLPITVATLGIFLLVVNAAMLGIVATILNDFSVNGLFSAVLGSLIVGVTGWIASWYIGPKGRFEILFDRKEKQ
jgi:putative membrane protein